MGIKRKREWSKTKMERIQEEGSTTQLTTLNGGRDFHSSPAFISQLTGWGLVPVGREIAKLIPELDDSTLGWKATPTITCPLLKLTLSSHKSLLRLKKKRKSKASPITNGNVLPILCQVLPHSPQQVPVLFGISKVLLVVCRLQDQVGHVNNPNNPSTCPAKGKRT